MTALKTLLFLVMMSLPVLTNAQVTIQGHVVDDDSQEPLSKASIKITGTAEVTLTDESGFFTLAIPAVNTFDTLVVTHVGYGKYSSGLSNTIAGTGLTIRLRKEITVLKEVSVYSHFWLKQYSPEQLKEDYEKFYTITEKVHTGLFDYLSETEWQALKDSSLQVIKTPLTHREFYQLIALHVGKIRNVHTRHGVTDSWYKQKQNIFPFNVKYFDDKLYVRESLVKNLDIPKGSEILTINGRTPREIKSIIWPFIPADGYILTGKTAALNDYFPWFFSLFVEETKEYTIAIKKLSGEQITITTSGISDSFAHFSFQQVRKWKKSAIEFTIDDTLRTAYFRIEDSRLFKDSIQTYFQQLTDKGIQNLIIDLRGGGGMREEEQVAELYSYLVDKPFRVFERIEVKSNDYTVFDKDFTYKPYATSLKQIKEQFFDKLIDSGQGYYLWEGEPSMGLLKPASIQFNGTVYILVDGRTYSASTNFTSLASQLKNVFIVGEETGGEYRSYVSGAMFGLVLPNSKIGVKIATWKSVLAIPEFPSQRGRGVMPDFYVTESFDDFLTGGDAVKEYVYRLIKGTKE
jgi:hypothetical protein